MNLEKGESDLCSFFLILPERNGHKLVEVTGIKYKGTLIGPLFTALQV